MSKQINLALQGGGSHGAFTWGVLDRLLEEPELDICAVSGASAGAMNAVVMAEGFHQGGAEGGRAALHRFWEGVGRAGQVSPFRRNWWQRMTGGWGLDASPGLLAMDLLSRMASPYDLNPLDLNPLRDVLEENVDFDKVRACDAFQLHIAATDVETGRPRIFRRAELSLDAVMASAALPHMFKAVELDGRAYWDGGYVGNPPLYPFYEHSPSDDILIVQLNPVVRHGVPKTAREIADRLNEITFNSALLGELRAIDFVRRLLEEGRLTRGEYRNIRLHMIHAPEAFRPLGAASKLNAEQAFLDHLFSAGRVSADKWIAAHFADVGEKQTLDVRKLLGQKPRTEKKT